MNRLPLLFLVLVSTAGAFSPSAVPRVAPHHVIGGSPLISQRSTIGASSRRSRLVQHTVQRSITNANINAQSTTTTALSMSTAAAEARQFNYKKRTAILMAFMTGWADWLFIKKYNFFATMMTGNSMKMANAFVQGQMTDALFFLSVIVSYILGVGAFRRAEYVYKDKALNGLFAPIVAGCFLWSDYLGWTNPAAKFLPAMLLSFSWGIINSVGSEVTGTLMFVLTGAMTRISNMIVDRISRTAGRKSIPKEGLLMSLSVIGGFILGAAWSSFMVSNLPQLVTRGAFSIMGGIYGLLFLWLDRHEFGAWWEKRDGKLCDIDADEVDCS